MENNRYNNSKIYKLVDQVNGYTYYGSTTDLLSKRFYKHKFDAKKSPERKIYSYFNKIGWDNVKIVLVEEHYLQNKEQLLREEDRVIQMYLHDEKCLNSRRSFIGSTKEEYKKEHYQNNKEKIQQKQKEYSEANKKEIQQKKKEWYQHNKEKISLQRKEYREFNKEEIQKYSKAYREINKQVLRSRSEEKEICSCGHIYLHYNKARHFQSKKHQAFVHDQQQTAETI